MEQNKTAAATSKKPVRRSSGTRIVMDSSFGRSFDRSISAPRLLDKLAPESLGVGAKQNIFAHRQNVPACALEFALDLAGRPAGESGIEAKRAAAACNERLDDGRMHAEIDAVRHLERRRRRRR